jgi:hypothetical protein
MTYRADPDDREDRVVQAMASSTWVAAAAAVSVLIISTITLTVVASGWDLGLPFG